jgi:RimJ/RimL family protein N-acetyltransferase
MLGQLPSPDNPDINKFAILLRPVEGNMQPWVNAKGRPKMVGMVGTNRFSDQGLETGYCINLKYWGKGYAGEGFKGFLDLFWSLPGE